MAGQGNPKTGGRNKGTRNKTTALLKDAILLAAANVGNELKPNAKDGLVAYLEVQAKENPVAFMGLLGKVLPLQIVADVPQRFAVVTDKIMTPEEFEEQWAKRSTH